MHHSVYDFIRENIEKTVKYSPKDEGTLIGLPYPYTAPCISEMFQEIYYWDTYFTNVGLLLLGKTQLAKNNVDNMLFLVEEYGYMPNGNRTYYLRHSQPPFLSRMVKDIFEVTHDLDWLSSAYKVLKKEYQFWQTKRVFENGLNGYMGYEFKKSDLDILSKGFLRRTRHKFEGEMTDQIKLEFSKAIMSFGESGWDCSSRFGTDGHHYCSIDLNSLLFNMEENMLEFSIVLHNDEDLFWQKRRTERLEKMQILWYSSKGYFTDYNCKTETFSPYFSAASFYPLFCRIATDRQAEMTIKSLNKLELEFGISGGEKNPKGNYQWDYPNIWAPIQFIVYHALMNYGYQSDAQRIAQKYIRLIDIAFKNTGNLWEKYDGNTANVVSIEYDAPPMMGWTAGVYVYFYKELGLGNNKN